MDISHLHLHTRDRAAAEAFYRRWFTLDVVRRGDSISFLRGDRSFLLALMDDPAPPPLPPTFHFGVLLDSGQAVQDLCETMSGAGVPIVKALYSDPGFASFRCADPDGNAIEVYWEDWANAGAK